MNNPTTGQQTSQIPEQVRNHLGTLKTPESYNALFSEVVRGAAIAGVSEKDLHSSIESNYRKDSNIGGSGQSSVTR